MSYAGKARRSDDAAQGEDVRAKAAPGKHTRAMELPASGGGLSAQWMGEALRPGGAPDASGSRSGGGAGVALPEEVRLAMEQSFGADFSAVRVHQDGEAAAMGAQAFARGTELHFAPGRYDPHSAEGKELLAHELAHVVQQADGRADAAAAQGKDAAYVDDPALEQEADAMAALAVRGEQASGNSGSGGSVGRVISSPASARPAQRRIDKGPTDYFDRIAPRDRDDEDKMLEHVRLYVYEVPVNNKQQTFHAVLSDVMQRAPKYRDSLVQEWESFLQYQRIGDAERCQDQLWTLAGFINQLYAVPGRLVEKKDARSSVAEWGDEIANSHGSQATDVESLDPSEEPYTVYTVDISGKVAGEGGYAAGDEDIEREEVRNHVLFRDITGKRFDFIFVTLPPNPSTAVFGKLVKFRGKDYRIDLMGGSFVKSGRALGVEAGSADAFSKLLGYEESVVYALRALFPQVVAGVKGTIRGRAYPVDAKKDPGGESLTFTLKDGKTQVQLNDGWGYVKGSLAAKMQEHEMSREKRTPEPQSSNANYQMTHWFDEVRPEVIQELVHQGLSQWQDLSDEAALLELQLKKAKKEERFEIEKKLRDNVEKRYSVLTTGRPPMESAVAMPVAGDKVVLPSGSQRFQDAPGGGVSLLRSPADKPNWRPVGADDVEHDSDRSKFLAGMEAIQYTWTGLQDGLMTFFKGMLGVISDEQWPDAWDSVDVVVTGEDRKLYEEWHSEEDRKQARSETSDFSIQGSMVATQWFDKGSVVGVPNEAMKWLGGDYDGDEVNILLETRNPEVTAQINDEYQEDQVNPKLPKSFTDNPEGSRDKRLVAMQSQNVSLWSGIAAKLRSMAPEIREKLAATLREGNILSEEELGDLEPEDAMWLEVGKGIKVGTDGYKTSVPVEKYEQRSRDYQMVLTNERLYALPYEKSLMKTIEKAGQPTLENGAWRDIYFSCTNGYDTGHAAPMWGVPAATLANMLYNLFPPKDHYLMQQHYMTWLREMRGYTG